MTDHPEIARARELLASTEETLRRAANRQPVIERRRLVGPYGEDWGLAPEEPRLTREAQAIADKQQAEIIASAAKQSTEVRRLARKVRELEAALLLSNRAATTGYQTTVMPGSARGRRK